MENLFLNIIQSLSDGRFWLGPLLLFCIFIIAVKTGLEAMEPILKRQNKIMNKIDFAAVALFIFCIIGTGAIILSWILNYV